MADEAYQVIQEITVDFSTAPPDPVVQTKQLDNAVRILRITMEKNGEPHNLTAGYVARLRGTKPDGTKIYIDAIHSAVGSNVVDFELSSNALAADGKATCEVELSDGAGDVVKSCNLILNVRKSALDDAAMQSTDEWQSLEKVAAQATGDSKAAADSAAAAAKSAETAKTLENTVITAAQTATQKAAEAGTDAGSAAAAKEAAQLASAGAQNSAAAAAQSEAKAAEYAAQAGGGAGAIVFWIDPADGGLNATINE